MVRSALAFFAVLILSGFAAVQQVATHTVVKGDTLWDLAQQYYQNPFDWRRIWEANKGQVADPNLILPGWVLDIPGREAEVSQVVVETPAEPAPTAEAPAPAAAAPPRPLSNPMKDRRTVFDRDTTLMQASVMRGGGRGYNPVPRSLVWSAPWVERLGREVEPFGRLESFAGGASSTGTVRGYDRVRVRFAGGAPEVGTLLQTYRREKSIESVGEVMLPTGVAVVREVSGDVAIAVVNNEFARLALGDFVRPVPAYDVEVGHYAQPVTGGPQAMVMGFAGPSVLQDVGNIAFLDQGADDGVNIGDEYEYLNPDAGREIVEGRLQVIGTTAGMASARILGMDDVVFRQGVVVRLARKMR